MAKQGRGKAKRRTKEYRILECLAAVLRLESRGKIASAHAIAREMGLSPSPSVRALLVEIHSAGWGLVENTTVLKNGRNRYEFWLDCDWLWQADRERWDMLAAVYPMQYPMFPDGGTDDIPF